MWEQELFEGFEYMNDKPFFHTFETDVSWIGDLGQYSVIRYTHHHVVQ